MRKKSIVRLLTYVIAVAICSFTSLPVQAKDCDYEVKYFPYITPQWSLDSNIGDTGKDIGWNCSKSIRKSNL